MGSRRPSTFAAIVLCTIAMSFAAAHPQNSVSLITLQSAAIPANLPTGATATLQVSGDPFAPFALATANVPAQIPTIWGTVGLAVTDPSFSILIDAFNPGSPNSQYGVLDNGGLRAFSFTPFAGGTPFGSTIYFQAISISPLNPFGFLLSNVLAITATPAAPVVAHITPNVVSLGQTAQVTGQDLGGQATGGAAPEVWIAGVQATVVAHTESSVDFVVPAAAHSGTLAVVTAAGTSDPGNDVIDSFVVVAESPVDESTAKATTEIAPTTIYATIDYPADVDTYSITLTGGEEVFVEVLPLDPSNFSVFAYTALSYGVALDPVIDVSMPTLVPEILAHDDNSGPGFGCAFGWQGTQRFIAPATGNYSFRISSSYAFSSGPYLLNVRTRPLSEPVSPKILALVPNNGNPGATVELVASGVDTTNPLAATVTLTTSSGSVTVTPTIGPNGLLAFVVPIDARSGHVRLMNGQGLLSVMDPDDFGSNFFVWHLPDLEDSAPAAQIITPNSSVFGVITQTWEADLFQVSLNAGEHVALRVFPFDITTNRVLRGALFSSAVVDPEVVVTTTSSSLTLTSDVHSGPGFSAEIGGLARAPWIVPVTQTYQITVRPWFFLSAGAYVFDLGVN